MDQSSKLELEPLARLRKDLLGEDASDLSIPERNNRLEWIVRNIVSSLQTEEEEDLFPTCPTETQEEAADEDDEDNDSERTTNVSPGRTTPSATMSATSTVVEEDREEDESMVPELLKAKKLAMEAALNGKRKFHIAKEKACDCQSTANRRILSAVSCLQATLDIERKEARAREIRYQKEMAEMKETLLGLTTLVEFQASKIAEERDAAQELRNSFADFRVESKDKEVRYTRLVSDVSTQIRDLNSAVDEMKAKAQQNQHGLSTALAKLKPTACSPKQPGVEAEGQEKRPESRLEEKLHSGIETAVTRNNPEPRKEEKDKKESRATAPGDDHHERKGNHEDENPWSSAVKKKRPLRTTPDRKQTIAPVAPSRPAERTGPGTLRGSGHVRRVVFYLNGIDPDCTAGDIAQYCADRNIKVSTCRILPSRRFGTSAARLSVAKQDAEREGIMSSNFWPKHIGIRLWAFPDVQPGDEWHPSSPREAPLQSA